MGFINSEPSNKKSGLRQLAYSMESLTLSNDGRSCLISIFIVAGYGGHGPMDGMGVTGMSPLAMMSMHEQYPWMKEKKSSRKQMGQGNPH